MPCICEFNMLMSKRQWTEKKRDQQAEVCTQLETTSPKRQKDKSRAHDSKSMIGKDGHNETTDWMYRKHARRSSQLCMELTLKLTGEQQ